MPTLPTHALIATTLYAVLPLRRRSVPLWAAGVVCAILPDADVIGFPLGVRYGDLLGHRGLTHSLTFAAVLGVLVASRWFPGRRLTAALFLFLCTALHGVFDAATDGGLGVAFFSPFSNQRYFWPWRPIRVAPIGLFAFSSIRARQVFATEVIWIWLPCAALLTYAATRRKLRV
jgi:inner membrane protein